MKIHRCRCAALVLAVALLAAPLASAAPIAPSAGSWWSAVLDALFGHFGDGTLTITAEEGPGLEPDGSSSNLDGTLPPIDDGSNDTTTDGSKKPARGSFIDPNG
jgi:hypothetical protein